MRKIILVAACVGAFVLAPAAYAADVTLGGGATAGPGYVQLASNTGDASVANDASWVDFAVPSSLTFGGLTALSTEFNVTDDGCIGGSPRFQVEVGGKNVFVYLGPSPSFSGCSLNAWLASGNLVGTSDACRVDTSQISPGTQCTTWAAAVTLLGSQTVTGIRLVSDSGWAFADKEQTVLVRDITINGRTYVTEQAPTNGNPAKLCSAQRASLGVSAFNELWGTNVNSRNAFGKCVSAMAKAKRRGSAADAQQAISSAMHECKAKGLRRGALGACVSERDGLVATKADPADRGKGKKKRKR